MNNERQNRKEIDIISKLSGFGSISSAQSDNIRAISVHHGGTPAPKNKESRGYTFFTRPDLNLSYDNLINDRMMSILASDDYMSMARALRATLDPSWDSTGVGRGDHKRQSGITDPRQAFIPLLSNNLLSFSGWPDITVPTFTSQEGNYKEAYSMADGTTHIYNTFDATANFSNIQGDPISLLFSVWCRYMSLVYDGTMVPYPENLFNNRIDYMTRIYRLVMDPRQEYVLKIAACGAGFPTASPLGATFNFDHEQVFTNENDQISVPFRCIGANYMDPILVKEFNDIVSYHNIAMRNGNRNSLMRKISRQIEYPGFGDIGHKLQNILSHELFPRINPKTMELEWWADNAQYDLAINELNSRGII